jgi:hypothetical protein
MVKFVTLDGYIFKGFMISIDLFNIFYALIVSAIIHNNPGIAECKEKYKTIYGLIVAMVTLGFLSVIRLTYFIFPHILGPKYF